MHCTWKLLNMTLTIYCEFFSVLDYVHLSGMRYFRVTRLPPLGFFQPVTKSSCITLVPIFNLRWKLISLSIYRIIKFFGKVIFYIEFGLFTEKTVWSIFKLRVFVSWWTEIVTASCVDQCASVLIRDPWITHTNFNDGSMSFHNYVGVFPYWVGIICARKC